MLQVRGDPVPRVQWYRDGMELDDPRFVAHFDGSHLCQLTIQELRDGDSGRYMCEATNRVGRVSTFARLFVVNDPKILEADHKLKRWGKLLRRLRVCFCCLCQRCKTRTALRPNNVKVIFRPGFSDTRKVIGWFEGSQASPS